MEMPLVSNVAERELLQAAESHQVLLEPDALRELLTCEDPQDVLQQAIALARGQNEFMVRHSLVADLIAARQLEKKSVVVVENTRFDVPAKSHEPDIRIFKDREVTRKSRCTGKLEDFVEHFKDRFTQMKGLMNNRRSEYPVMDRLSRAAGKGQREKMRLVGMVYEKRTTKNGHVLIELEDETATVTALVSNNSKILGLTQSLMEDEVVAFDGFFNGELFILDIVWPDVPIRDKKHGEADVNIGFLSDLHVGSKYFLQHQFQHFLEFLNGKGTDEEKKIAGKIKYLFIAGDLVDGIGVYPTQEKQLITKDIYEQYKSMGEFLMQIPDHIHVILAPGNHDPNEPYDDMEAGKNDFLRFGHRPDDKLGIATAGSSLGWGPGAALGIKLGAPDRQVVLSIGDGSVMYSASGFWSFARYQVPVLTIVWNNRNYQTVRGAYARYEKRMAATGHYHGVYLGDPDIDFVKLAESQGVRGQRVTSAGEIGAALKKGAAEVSHGSPYVIEFVVACVGPGAESTWHQRFSAAGARSSAAG